MAVYSFYSSNEDFVFSELSERAGGIGGLNMRMKSVDFKFVDFMFSIFVPKKMDMETLFYIDGSLKTRILRIVEMKQSSLKRALKGL